MLGMGVERGARGNGLGRALLAAAIAWARTAELAWLDLGVFAHNERARALYRTVGFVEVGTTRDRFRVDGVVIDDVAMVLAL
jgi:ribosomal protein S18 acetylase RimI-like enzyme